MMQGFDSTLISLNPTEQFLANLLISLICGLIISYIYRWTYRGPHYLVTFVQSIVILPMVTTLVIMVIGNNLARAFGLVGAMSIIRFRTAVKDTQDIVFIFFSLASGMAAGVGLRLIALTGTLLIGMVLLFLNRTNYAKINKAEFLLQFVCKITNGEGPYLETIRNFCKENRLINTQTLDQKDLYELSYHVRIKQGKKSVEFVKALNNIPQISEVRLFYDEE